MSSQKILFVGIPVHDGKIHQNCVAGMMQTQTRFANRIAFDTHLGSFLPRNRDVLTAHFLDSGATHMLCLDSDIGFTPDDVQALLDTDLDFVSGCYAKKQPDREIPAKLNGKVSGDCLGVEHAPAGFLMLSRGCVERMVGAYRKLEYQSTNGRAWGLWQPTNNNGEDVSFCYRWTEIGGSIWIHPGVILNHYGEHCYTPGSGVDMKFSK